MDHTKIAEYRSDYYSALSDYELTHEFAIKEMVNLDFDDSDIEGLYLSGSDIHGSGVFASKNIKSHDSIGLANNGNMRTILGRYVNHSPRPNAKPIKNGNVIEFVAICEIFKDEEILIDYRESIAFRFNKPEENLLSVRVNNGKLETVDNRKRSQLSGMESATYDLLFGEDHIKHLTYTERVLAFEAKVARLPQQDLEVKHEFLDGLYKREITFKENMVVTGAVHIKDHFDVMLTGEMLVATKKGFERLVAPCTLVTKAGSKKAGVAIKETRWATYHATNAKTVKDAEREIMVDNTKDFEVGICQEQ